MITYFSQRYNLVTFSRTFRENCYRNNITVSHVLCDASFIQRGGECWEVVVHVHDGQIELFRSLESSLVHHGQGQLVKEGVRQGLQVQSITDLELSRGVVHTQVGAVYPCSLIRVR